MLTLRCIPFFNDLYYNQFTGVVAFCRCTRSCKIDADLPPGRIVNRFPQQGWETLYAFIRRWQKCTIQVELSHLYRPGYKMVIRDFVLAAATTMLSSCKKKLHLKIRPPIMWGIDAVSGIYAPLELVFDRPHTVDKVTVMRAYINTVVFGLYWPNELVVQHSSHLLSIVSLSGDVDEGVVPTKIRLVGCPELVGVPLHVSLRTPIVDIEDCSKLAMSFKAAHTFYYSVTLQSAIAVEQVLQQLSDAPNATKLFLSLSAAIMDVAFFFDTEWVAPAAKHAVIKNGSVQIGRHVEHCCIYFPENVSPNLSPALRELELMYTDMDMSQWIADVPSGEPLALSRVHLVHDSTWSNECDYNSRLYSWVADEDEALVFTWKQQDLLTSVDLLLQKCAPDALVRITSLLSSNRGISITFSRTKPHEVARFRYNTDRWTSLNWPSSFLDCIVDVETVIEHDMAAAAAHLYKK